MVVVPVSSMNELLGIEIELPVEPGRAGHSHIAALLLSRMRRLFLSVIRRRLKKPPRGERCRAAIPHGHWKTTTLTAGLRIGGLAAPMVMDGPMPMSSRC